MGFGCDFLKSILRRGRKQTRQFFVKTAVVTAKFV